MSQGEATPYEIEVRPRAAKQLSKLPKRAQQAIDEKILSLRDDPRQHGATLLSSQERLYRVRTGDYRIVYQISDDRKDVYRNLN